jgi:cellulose biosynthesis protein BcsQ
MEILEEVEEPGKPASESKAVSTETKKPVVASFSNNKGGVGKTRAAITTANFLGACGKKVCVVDMDFNNSATFYYLRESQLEAAKSKNIADALGREDNNLAEFALETAHEGVSLIASSRYLADLRSINEKRLSRMIGFLAGIYDVVIIDCQPDYNNLTLNALNASDIIITPVLKDLDSFNAAVFLGQKIELETDKIGSWYIHINGYNKSYEDAAGGKQKEYITVYRENFRQMTPPSTWFPWTPDMNEIKDKKKRLAAKPVPGAVCNPELYEAVANLAECFVEEEKLPRPEVI